MGVSRCRDSVTVTKCDRAVKRTWHTEALRLRDACIFVSFLLMDKTKSRLAAFFDNDEDDSSFPVRRIELFHSNSSALTLTPYDSKRPWTIRSSHSMHKAR